VELDHVVIKVSDWDRANAFYRDVVGAELVEIARGRFAYRLGRTQLNVHGPGSSPEPLPRNPVEVGNSDLCFAWDGPIEGAIAHLRSHDVEIVVGPTERQGAQGTGNSVYFNDPDGSLLELISYQGAE
jgi:catechol 2,3-dioxygenase-like lactoylglutathione lyase family enzyme